MSRIVRTGVVVTKDAPEFLVIDILKHLLHEEEYQALTPPNLGDPSPFIKEVRPAAVVFDLPFRRETQLLTTLDKLHLDRATTAIPVVVCAVAPRELQGLQDHRAEGLYLLAEPSDLEHSLSVLVEAPRAQPAPSGTG